MLLYFNNISKKEQYQLNWDCVKIDFEYLVDKYEPLLNTEENIDEDNPIWMMWYQGIENAPPIVLSCVQSVIENRAKHSVHIISKYNLDKYIKLPNYIIRNLIKVFYCYSFF